jgi:hypothetical protein
MTPDEAAEAWLRFLLRTGPTVDVVVVRSIAERLASAADSAELLALSEDLFAIAEVVKEEAMCDAPASAHAVSMH